METFFLDVRYGARMFAKHRAFTMAAVITLALGIGANTAIFSVINGVLLKPLPYEKPGELVMLWEDPGGHGRRNPVAGGVFTDWKEHSSTLEDLSVVSGTYMNLTGDAQPERITGWQVSSTYLEILRVHPLH